MVTSLMKYLKAQGHRQYHVARVCGIGDRRLSAISNGHAEAEQWEKAALAKFLRVSGAKLFPADERVE